MKKKIDSFFGISKSGSTIGIEIIAGLVTFLAMAYILTLNPSLITNDWTNSTPMWQSVFIATALGAVVGTLLMAFLAKMPLAQAPGLGLDSMVGGIIGGSLGFAISFGNAMLLVLISGIVFLLCSVVKIKGVSIREMIFDGIPVCVRGAISVGIGLFIAFIGMQNSGIIQDSNTLVSLATFNGWGQEGWVFPSAAIVCLFGLLCIAILEHFHIKGSVIIGVVLATILGIPLGVTNWSGNSWKFWEYFTNFFSMDPANGGTFLATFTEGFSWDSAAKIMPCVMTVISFCMVDMFDTMGTVVGCTQSVGLVDENGKPIRYNKIMLSDSIATCTGSLFGTSTVTTFVESGSGIAAGGRTGLTALTTAICFLLSIFLLPLIASVPSAAASSALLYVGCLMLRGAKNIHMDGIKNLVPAFLTVAMMPLAYSITTGIGIGILSYVVIDIICYVIGKIRYAATKNKEKVENPKWDLSPVCLIVAVLFLVYFFVPTTF